MFSGATRLRGSVVRVADTFRVQVVQSPHLRDQLCQVIDADEDTIRLSSFIVVSCRADSLVRKLCHCSINNNSFYKSREINLLTLSAGNRAHSCDVPTPYRNDLDHITTSHN